VLEHIRANPGFIQPDSRHNEVVSKLEAGVNDLSISRATLTWGIPMPNDPKHVVYVWIDALSNYISALGYGTGDDSRFRRYWPADVHLIGKEIMWFHTVYWPAVLMAIDVPLPKQVFAHGWWTAEGRKMSKSMGNFIDLPKIRSVCQTYSLDAFRYYLLRAAPFGSDLDWNDADFLKSYNELGNVIGNCLNRTVKMVSRYRHGKLPAAGELHDIDRQLMDKTHQLERELPEAYEKMHLQQAVTLPLELARATNGYIDATEPFKLAKDPTQEKRLDTVLNLSAQAIYRVLLALEPVLPNKAAEAFSQLGTHIVGRKLGQLFAEPLRPGHHLGEAAPLFPKVETA
jgi:methionyl-tRNA synthetase